MGIDEQGIGTNSSAELRKVTRPLRGGSGRNAMASSLHPFVERSGKHGCGKTGVMRDTIRGTADGQGHCADRLQEQRH